jgi:hypothetical protein
MLNEKISARLLRIEYYIEKSIPYVIGGLIVLLLVWIF